MTWRDGVSVLPHSNEVFVPLRVVRLARQCTEGRQSQISETDIHLNINDAACRASELTRNGKN
jgi:hypothetical protein